VQRLRALRTHNPRDACILLIISQWLNEKDDQKNLAWARATYAALRPHTAAEAYVNDDTDEQTQGALEQAYGPNYARLVALKNRLDPTNLFHANNNIRPTL
jgi:FAD/FMN-containing dehydrogenase